MVEYDHRRRPVACLAILTAFSTASAPELNSADRLSCVPGVTRFSSSHTSTYPWYGGSTMKQVRVNLATGPGSPCSRRWARRRCRRRDRDVGAEVDQRVAVRVDRALCSLWRRSRISAGRGLWSAVLSPAACAAQAACRDAGPGIRSRSGVPEAATGRLAAGRLYGHTGDDKAQTAKTAERISRRPSPAHSRCRRTSAWLRRSAASLRRHRPHGNRGRAGEGSPGGVAHGHPASPGPFPTASPKCFARPCRPASASWSDRRKGGYELAEVRCPCPPLGLPPHQGSQASSHIT